MEGLGAGLQATMNKHFSAFAAARCLVFEPASDNLPPGGMMFYLGKTLQLSGLLTLIWALILGFKERDAFGELTLLAVGALVFALGSVAVKRGSAG